MNRENKIILLLKTIRFVLVIATVTVSVLFLFRLFFHKTDVYKWDTDKFIVEYSDLIN